MTEVSGAPECPSRPCCQIPEMQQPRAVQKGCAPICQQGQH